jgi:16S rRNA (cytosine967-C5)-methyltransferase
MNSVTWSPEEYDLAIQLWRLWLTETKDREIAGESYHLAWPALDRWLKRSVPGLRGRVVKDKSDRRPKKSPALPLAIPAQLAVSAAMFAAMRFLQLACALEQSYREQTLLAWDAWDQDWSRADVQRITPVAFWYWIALRGDSDHKAPPVVRDADERKAWFMQFKETAAGQGEALMPETLLWHGLRPQWAALLRERAQTSGWTHEDLHRFVDMQHQSPPLWLRAQGTATPERLQQELLQEGVQATLHEQTALYARGGTGIHHTNAFKEGRLEIQDLASQHIAAIVAAKPGEKVWDACAGAGGKSLAIAARMNNKGVIVATDLHAYKLDELKRRAKRAELFNIRTFTWQGDEALRLPKEVAQQQGFDWVLIDAPCTSSGTWRRNPDARWRFSPQDTSELVRLQQQILHHASAAVRINGHLVYATCSWQLSENEQQVAEFLHQHPEYSLVMQSVFGAPQWDSDIMFAAVLVRLR